MIHLAYKTRIISKTINVYENIFYIILNRKNIIFLPFFIVVILDPASGAMYVYFTMMYISMRCEYVTMSASLRGIKNSCKYKIYIGTIIFYMRLKFKFL